MPKNLYLIASRTQRNRPAYVRVMDVVTHSGA